MLIVKTSKGWREVPEVVNADFRFLAHRISDFSFSLQEGVKNMSISLDIDPDLEYKCLDNGCYIGLLTLSVKVRGRSGRKISLKLDASIKGKFEAPASMEKNTFESFCMISGTATLIPLLRAAILSFTSQAGMNPPIKIPLINVPQSLSKAGKKEGKEQSKE